VIKNLAIQDRWLWFENHILRNRVMNSGESICYRLFRQIGDSLEPSGSSAMVIADTIVNHISE
jgi:hypothetical protein